MLDGELHRLSELGSHIVAKIQRQVNRPDRPLDIWRLASGVSAAPTHLVLPDALCQPGFAAGGGVGVQQAFGHGHVDSLLSRAIEIAGVLASRGIGDSLDAGLQLGFGRLVTGSPNLVLAVALDL
jgi:hypothetical protein